MATKYYNQRIRSRARKEAALLGHDIGRFTRTKYPNGRYSQPIAKCRNCGWSVGQQFEFIYSNGWHLEKCKGKQDE